MKVEKLKWLLERVKDDKDIVIKLPYGDELEILKIEDEDDDVVVIRAE